MRRRILLYLAAFLMTTGAAIAQSGKMQGKITDATTGETIPFANVIVKQKGAQKGGAAADFDGIYVVSPLNPGTYDVEISYVGYHKKIITGVTVMVDQTRYLNVALENAALVTPDVEIIAYKEPIIDPDNTSSKTTFTKEQIQKMSTRETTSIASASAAVFASDDRASLNIKGARSAGTIYYINGVKVMGGAPNLPTSSIEQMSVLSGGTPAQYGDALGGIVNITTQGPSSQFFGGIALETSAPFDKYDNNLAEFSLSGPIITRKSDDTLVTNDRTNTVLGFFISGQYLGSQDASPSAAEIWYLKPETESSLNDPFYIDDAGALQLRSETLTKNDMELQKNGRRRNHAENNYLFNGSLDFRLNKNTTFTLGGSFERRARNGYGSGVTQQQNYLLNSQNNQLITSTNYNAYGRFTQRFSGNDEDSSGLVLKNAYYQIQADYAKQISVQEDKDFKDDYFKYGQIGTFSYEGINNQVLDSITIDGVLYPTIYTPTGGQTLGLKFDGAGSPNPILANYNNSLLRLEDDISTPGFSGFNSYNSFFALGGLRNGDNPRPVGGARGGLFQQYGWRRGVYQVNNNDQFRLSALGSAQVNNHTFTLGFEFEQRVQTYYQLLTNPLWAVGRGMLNRHLDLGQLNYDSGLQIGTDPDGTPIYTFDYSYQQNGDSIVGQSTFDRNVRAALGKGPGEFIDIDQLSPQDVSKLGVGMFSASELLDNQVIAYQGYTHDGKRNTKKSEFSDFFSNAATRPQDAFRPVYTAVFLEDKFAIDDLILRLGVRVDRYDANQPVLKDKYAMVDLETVGELGERYNTFANADNLPTPGSDWVVYVDSDPLTASSSDYGNFNITGFRSGDTFYNAQGEIVDNPNEVRSSGGYFPFFTRESNPSYIESRRLSQEAFKDYEPQITVAPRLSFSFPISEDALFFAHYDVLAQRPEQNQTTPSDFYYLAGQVNNLLSNGALKPQKKIDYQIGFQQRLTQSSGLTLKAFYSDYRDMIQVRQIVGSYPQSPYLTFDNIDYGTVKGLTMEYDLRRTANLTLGASYTLQFAQGTGSGATSGFDLAQAGNQLRTLIPTDYDQRHALKLNVDYRFRDGEGIIAGSPILQNAGINFNIYAGSGTPYSRSSNATTTADFTVNERAFLAGSPNGSRLPGNVRAGLRIDKDFKLNFGKGENKAPKVINVYYRVQNLFNAQNVLNVYRYTGSATDDAYISQRFLPSAGDLDANELSYVDLYMIKLQNPQNFTLPRRSYIGVTFNF